MIIELQNIQSIRKAVYDIEEKGITQITGENSNGKSILIKAMAFVANGLIKDATERETLITDDMEAGSIIMKRNGMRLKVVVSRIRENCSYELTRKTGEVITRTIREGGLDKLAEEFGWISFDGNVCLQIFETFGIMPFVNNRPSSDYEIIDYIITDKVANNFVEAYEKVTYPRFKQYVADLKASIDNADRILDGITFYDIQKYEDILYKLKKYYRNINYLHTFSPTRLPITKAFRYIDVKPVIPNRLPIYKVAPTVPNVSSLYQLISDYNKTANGECPTCGTKLKDREVHNHAV